jgi:hypothetical protein
MGLMVSFFIKNKVIKKSYNKKLGLRVKLIKIMIMAMVMKKLTKHKEIQSKKLKPIDIINLIKMK